MMMPQLAETHATGSIQPKSTICGGQAPFPPNASMLRIALLVVLAGPAHAVSFDLAGARCQYLLKRRIRSDPLWLSARPLTIPSCGVRFRTQRTCYRVCCISVGAGRCQSEKNASPGGQRIYATQEIAHGVAKGGLIILIQCVQEPVAQDRGSAL